MAAAAGAAATDVMSHGFTTGTSPKVRPTTTNPILADSLVKLRERAFCSSVLPLKPLRSSFSDLETKTTPKDARVTPMRPHIYELQPIQWKVLEYLVDVPDEILLDALRKLRCVSADLNPDVHSLKRQSYQLPRDYQSQTNDSIRWDGTSNACMNGVSNTSSGFSNSTGHSITKSDDQFSHISGNPRYRGLAVDLYSPSAGPFESLPSSRSESQSQYGLPQNYATRDTQVPSHYLNKPSSSASSTSVPPYPPLTLLQEPFRSEAKHDLNETFQTSPTLLVPQNNSSVNYSDQDISSAFFETSQDYVQRSDHYVVASASSDRTASTDAIYLRQIIPQAAESLLTGRSQPEAPPSTTLISFNRTPLCRGSPNHHPDDQLKKKFSCAICLTFFISRQSLRRHEDEVHQQVEYWCPPAGLVTKGNDGGNCAVCGLNNPDVHHFLTAHYFGECYCTHNYGTRRRFKRKDEFIKHLKRHNIYKGDLCSNRDLRYAKNKGTYACGYCPTIFLEWNTRQEHLTHHLQDSMILQWDNSVVIEALLSQNYVRGAWRKLLSVRFPEGQFLDLAWLENETNGLQSSLEEKQAPAHAEKLAGDASVLAVPRPGVCLAQRPVLSNRFGLPGSTIQSEPRTEMLNRRLDCDLPGPLTLPWQMMSADVLNDQSLQTNSFDGNNVTYPARIRGDHAPELPFQVDADGNEDMDWT
ncbi:hypothetical protein MMC18_004792 [Xylographa bjoerkii]|nr:hypothetical protein [Xylographa bjoerkii]